MIYASQPPLSQAVAERDVILKNLRAVLLPYQAEVVQVTRVVRQALLTRRHELTRLLTKPSLAGEDIKSTSRHHLSTLWACTLLTHHSLTHSPPTHSADYLRNSRTFAVLCDWFSEHRDQVSINW